METFAAWLRRGRRKNQEHFVVCSRADEGLVGVINLNEIVRGVFQNAFVGFYGFEGRTGGGRMTEGLHLVARHAFQTMKLHRLEANIQPDNARSIALARRAGFEHEGTARAYLKIAGRWRDHEHWVRLRR
jgi:ribosomal-protein-alanine N-acetyltransferase